MKTTEELYRCNAKEWRDLPYHKALHTKEILASKAMTYYRDMSREHIKNSYLVKEYEDLYLASEDARDFNRELIEELNESE